MANGAPAETFFDYVGRQAFDNYAEYVALYGDEPEIVEMPLPRISSRRQLPSALLQRFGIQSIGDEVTKGTTAFLAKMRV